MTQKLLTAYAGTYLQEIFHSLSRLDKSHKNGFVGQSAHTERELFTVYPKCEM